MKSKAVFIFRRDLRCEDNLALIQACAEHDEVLPVFIFDPVQLEGNSYFATNAFRFLLESLEDLKQQLGGRLRIFYGSPVEVLSQIKAEYDFGSVFFTLDYTPFSRKRDKAIIDWCEEEGIECRMMEGLLLNSVKQTLKADGTPYTVFTPFYKNAKQFTVSKPQKFNDQNICSEKFSFEIKPSQLPLQRGEILQYAPEPAYKGGRSEAKKQLQQFLENYFDAYGEQRNLPALSATSGLSAHLKFGTISPREVYHAIADPEANPFVSELYWRDFFTQIGWYFPHVFEGEKNFRSIYDNLEWENEQEKFLAWCRGETGYPIVDAGMRELNQTGFMHNRVRMITASFLVKDLHIDWKWGERYFAHQLIDYDPAVNNGNWQWAASTGCDAQPYFRIFNPWRQMEKFDPDCEYIRRWIPELQNESAKEIQQREKLPPCQRGIEGDFYPNPIIDHKIATQKTKEMYSKCREKL